MMSKELERAEAMLAEIESLIAEGLGGPYAEQNLATYRKRAARLRAAMPSAPVPAVLPAPKPKPAPAAPQPTGKREERLRRLARAMGGDEASLAAAIKAGTSPDAFALQLTDQMIARRKAAAEAAEIKAMALRIAHPTPASVPKGTPKVEALAKRIINA